MPSQTRQALLAAFVTFGLALVLRLSGTDLRAPWLDEVYSQFAVSRDWYGLAADRISRGHSPLYFALMKAMGLGGEDIVAMRNASSVFDSAGAAILAAALARHVNLRAGILFGLLYACAPLAIHWAQNARPYGLLTLFLGIGLAGAAGLFATLGRDVPENEPGLRWPMRTFGLGFSMASLTLTAGIIAFVTLAAGAYVHPRVRADAAFRRLWRRALRVPAIVSVLGYFAFSGPHIARQVDGYWAEKYTTLGAEGLGRLWRQVLVDDGLAVGLSHLGLGAGTSAAALWLLSATLVFFAVRGALTSRDNPALLAPAILLAGYVGLMICVSAWTSVLVSRYFLPPLICLLALAGAGMAAPGAGRWTWALILPALAVFAVSGVSQARLPEEPPDRALAPVAAIIARVPAESVRVLYEKKDDSRNGLTLELFPLRYTRPELGRPDMNSFRLDRLEEARAEGRDVFSYMTEEALSEALAGGAPAPACGHPFDGWVLAYWGTNPAACTR